MTAQNSINGMKDLPMADTASYFTIEASLGRSTIKAGVLSTETEAVVEQWGEWLAKAGVRSSEKEPVIVGGLAFSTPNDPRMITRHYVYDSLKQGKYERDEKEWAAVISALVWLTVTGPAGPRLFPEMKAGTAAIAYELTEVEGGRTFTFYLRV